MGTCSESAVKMDTKESFGIPIKENLWGSCEFCSVEKFKRKNFVGFEGFASFWVAGKSILSVY